MANIITNSYLSTTGDLKGRNLEGWAICLRTWVAGSPASLLGGNIQIMHKITSQKRQHQTLNIGQLALLNASSVYLPPSASLARIPGAKSGRPGPKGTSVSPACWSPRSGSCRSMSNTAGGPTTGSIWWSF